MRIAIVCSYYPWPPSIGGVETIVRNATTELTKRGHDVHVVTTPFDVTTMKQVSDYGMEERDGVTIHKLKPRKLKAGYARFLNRIKDVISKVKPEIVHSHNLHPHLFQLAKWKDELMYKLVAELHYPAINFDFFVQRLLSPLAMYLLRRRRSSIDNFIAHTKLERQWLISEGVRNKVEVVRPPMIPSWLLSCKPKSKLDDNSNSKRLLYIGRVVPKKGLHVLLMALSSIEEGNLIVAGPTEKKYYKRLIHLAIQLELKDRVKFIGPVPEKKKFDLMSTYDAFVCPTLADYHPITLIEAQALGMPVISTRVGAIPEIVVHGKTGLLVEPHNDAELANAIATMLRDNKMKDEFSKNAKEFAELYTVESSVNALEYTYGKLIR